MAMILPAVLALTALAQSQRSAEQFVISDSLPPIRVEVDSSFGFLGHAVFAVGGVAEAEQFIYGDLAGGRLTRAVIVHFERFLPHNDSHFRYPSAPADSLGRHSYLHQHWRVGAAEFFSAPEVTGLLARRGVTLDSAYIMDRHVRVVDSVGKHEVILFYLEGVSTFPSTPGRIAPSVAGNVPAQVARAMADRARRSFRVVED